MERGGIGLTTTLPGADRSFADVGHDDAAIADPAIPAEMNAFKRAALFWIGASRDANRVAGGR